MTRFVAIASLALLTAFQSAKVAIQPVTESARVDAIMSPLAGAVAPGAAVIVIRDGTVVHQKGYGLANVEARAPIAASTTFNLASVSKPFTAMAIMMLAERGRLTYSDSLARFFPEFPAYASKITVRHLLNHTSGLPDYEEVFEGRPAGISREPTSREVMTMLAQVPAPHFAAGERWEYSNSGYVALAQIVEKVSGLSFPTFMKTNVFEPLTMTSTIVSDQITAPSANRAVSYAPSGDGFRNADYTPLNKIYGDGNVHTSIEDMFKWDQALYGDGLVRQSSLAEAFTPATLNNGSLTGYGFGWTIDNVNGLRILSHSGAWAGFRTFVMRIPTERFSVIVLSNAGTFSAVAAGKRIAHVYLGDKVSARAMVSVDPKILAALVGKYELRPGLILEVSIEADTLILTVGGQAKLPLAAESATRFYAIESDEIGLTFNTDATGKVTGLTLHQSGDHFARRLPD